MDLRDTPDEAQFRTELGAWFEANLPESLRGHRGGEARYSDDAIRDWSRMLYEAGYVGLTWPKDYGGGGKSYSYQAIFLEEMARAEAPQHLGVIGLGMAGLFKSVPFKIAARESTRSAPFCFSGPWHL